MAIIDTSHAEKADDVLKEFGGLSWLLRALATDPAFVERQQARLREDAAIREALAVYALALVAAMEACGFSWWNRDRITGANFPGEVWDGSGEYDLEWQPLGKTCENADEIDEVVRGWMATDKTILGSGSAGDGIFLAGEFKAGRRDQPNGWIVCPGSTSVDGGLLYLNRDGASRWASVASRGCGWVDDSLVLLRKARKP